VPFTRSDAAASPGLKTAIDRRSAAEAAHALHRRNMFRKLGITSRRQLKELRLR
jgi:hypothetical protein